MDPDHADQDRRQHELHDRHVLQQHGADLFFEAQDASLLQQDPEGHTGDQSQPLLAHGRTPFPR